MRRIVAVALVTLAASWLTLAQEKMEKKASHKKGGGSVADQIKKLEDDRNQAILKADTATLDRLTSEDYTFTNAKGKLLKKSEILEGFKAGTIKFDSRQLSDLDVHVHGNAAVITGQVTQKSSEGANDTSGDYRFTRVYVKEKGQWVTVATQVTAIAKQ